MPPPRIETLEKLFRPPPLVVTNRPGARPARLWVMFAVGALIMSSVLTLAMAAVVLRLEVVP